MDYSHMDQTATTSLASSSSLAAPLRQNRRTKTVYSMYSPNPRFSRYNDALRSLLPIRLQNQKSTDLTVHTSGLFSFITFHWIFQYLWDTLKYNIPINVPLCPNPDSCTVNSPRLDGLLNYQRVKEGYNLSVTSLLWKFVKTRTIFACILYICAWLLSIIGLIMFLPGILHPKFNFSYMFALLYTEIFACLLFSWSNAINLRTAIRLRSACFSSLFRQAMLTSLTFKLSSWQLVSFLLSEGQYIQDLVMIIPNLICTPIILICSLVFVGAKLGLWGYMSITIILIFFPIFIIVALLSKNLLYRAALFSDQRVKLLEEFIINNIYVKFFKQENMFRNNIAEKREQEVQNMRRAGLYDNICFSFILLQPLLSLTALFIAYNMNIADSSKRLAEFAAICIILLIHINQLLNNFWYGLNSFIKGIAALNKFKKIMMLDNIETKSNKPKDNLAIEIEDAYFQWTRKEILNIKNPTSNVAYADQNFIHFPSKIQTENVLCEINMNIEKGKLIGICGVPGSGKTSLLLAVMGLLLQSKGKRKTIGNFAYVSQEPQIFNESLKSNIIFGNELDTQRYYRTTMYSNLQEDISHLPENDDTVIESKYLTLEQKQRIALARALYVDGEIYLLDKPLSALEFQKSLQIFDNCILKSLQEKTILLVTDQVEFLEQCDEIFMLYDGRIMLQGTHKYLMKNESEYTEFISYLTNQKYSCREKSTLFETSAVIPSTPKDITVRKFSSNYSIFDSINSLDTVDAPNANIQKANNDRIKTVLASYLTHFGNICSIIFLLLAQIMNATFISFLPIYFIFSLLEAYNLIFLLSYFGVFVTMLLLGVITNYYFNKKMFTASIRFHNELLRKLYKATLSFLQTKSLGIISTFSLQLQLTDLDIPRLIHNILLNAFLILITLCIIPMISPWYIISLTFSIVLMILAALFVRNALMSYNQFGMDYIDILYTQVMTILTARPIIQAYDKVQVFSKRLYSCYDEYITYIYIINAAKGWLVFLLQSLSVILFGLIGFQTIINTPSCFIWETLNTNPLQNCSNFENSERNITACQVEENVRIISCKALAIVCALQLCFALQRALVLYVNASLGFDMLARVQKFKQDMTIEGDEDYDDFEDESNNVLEEKAYSIDFVNVTLETEKVVLNKITFKIRENEKYGFLGLSSSQRKAIIAILYKLTDITSGNVMIDKKRMSQIPLYNLRNIISVIPAEPYLFNTSIKKFLNIKKPFLGEITALLDRFTLWNRIERLPNKLDASVDQYFNSEEKQILCLARAFMEQSPVLIIEDYVNGSKLEYILATQLKELFPQSTVIVFANNELALRNCDRFAIVKKGKIKSIGTITATLNSEIEVEESNPDNVPETSF